MSNLGNNNKLNNNELQENELDNVSGGGIASALTGWFGSGEKTAEGSTQNQMSEGASEAAQDAVETLSNTGAPITTVPAGTDTVVPPITPATVEQTVSGETKQSFSSGAGTNSRRRKRSF